MLFFVTYTIKAARVSDLEKELDEMKRMFLDHTEQLSETKTKHHLGLWTKAIRSTKRDGDDDGEKKEASGGGTKDEELHAENKGELHEVFRENIALRLRLLSGQYERPESGWVVNGLNQNTFKHFLQKQ